MLRRQRKIRAQLQRVIDAGLFGLSLWVAHWIRMKSKLALFGGTPEIESFENYVWLLLMIMPLAPVLLEMQGFYSRSLLVSRRTTAWELFKGCVLAVLVVISVMFLMREQLARSRLFCSAWSVFSSFF